MSPYFLFLVAFRFGIDLPAVVADTKAIPNNSSPRLIEARQQTGWVVGETVQTSSGPVQGHAAKNDSSVSEYLGIPYARPPIGNLRFAAPVKYTGTSTINGANFGLGCLASASAGNTTIDYATLRLIGVTDGAIKYFVEPQQNPPPKGEDCLTLNVWTKPQTGESKKPVMVYIHGGGFTSGDSAELYYNGQYLAEEQDVVVVTMNYRLNIFGFPGNPTTPMNLGLLDQRMAIEWVRDNIAKFGGDTERITLFGQSAGAASIDYYSYAWESDPIVHGLISQSGIAAAFGVTTTTQASMLWYQATALVGCGSITDDPTTVLKCMQGKPVDDIVKAVPKVTSSGGTYLSPFTPVTDDKLVFADTSTRKAIAVPMLVGSCDNEMGFYRLIFAISNTALTDALWEQATSTIFTCPAARRAARSVQDGNPTWRYRYFGEFPNLRLTTKPSSGAWHGSDIFGIFNTTDDLGIAPQTPEQVAVGRYIRGAWAAFARNPASGLDKYDSGWPRFSTTGQSLIRLAFDNQTGTNLAAGNQYDNGCINVSTVTSPPVSASPSASACLAAVCSATVSGVVPTPTNAAAGRLDEMSGLGIWVIAAMVAAVVCTEMR